jgi:hypothetical protein
LGEPQIFRTPKELVNILREAMAKSFKDPGFAKNLKNSRA